MRCPIPGRTVGNACRKEDCAWWCKQKQKCAVLVIAEKENETPYMIRLRQETEG